MNMSKALRHHNRQLATNQLLGLVPKDSLDCGIGKNYLALLINREHRNRGGLGNQTKLRIGRIERSVRSQSFQKDSYLSTQGEEKLLHLQ
jgi:hypothetical protein